MTQYHFPLGKNIYYKMSYLCDNYLMIVYNLTVWYDLTVDFDLTVGFELAIGFYLAVGVAISVFGSYM